MAIATTVVAGDSGGERVSSEGMDKHENKPHARRGSYPPEAGLGRWGASVVVDGGGGDVVGGVGVGLLET